MDNLPWTVLVKISENLDHSSALALLRSCKTIHEKLNIDSFWQILCSKSLTKIGIANMEHPETGKWRDVWLRGLEMRRDLVPGVLQLQLLNAVVANTSNSHVDDYGTVFWPQLKIAIDEMLLFHPPWSISYEKTYTAVFWCVRKQYSEQLYADLMALVRTRLDQWTSRLSNVSEDKLIQEYKQYFHALGGIVDNFIYMNRCLHLC